MKDLEFSKAREVLSSKKRQLVHEFGKGNRPQARRQLTGGEEDLLYTMDEFGDQNPEVLQKTVWWTLGLQYGFRARDESKKMKWGDVQLEIDAETGNEVLICLAERGSKTRKGEGPGRAFCPIAQATNNVRCPVYYYKQFKSNSKTLVQWILIIQNHHFSFQ